MAKKKQKKTPGLDKWASQAAIQALLRYGPEESGLAQLQADALGTYKTTVAQARGGAESTINAIDAAKPGLAQLYDEAGLAQGAQSSSLIGKDLAGLTGVADSIKAGAASEAATGLTNLRRARTSILENLTSRRVAAREGSLFATENARRDLVSSLEKIFQRKQDLAGEKGAFTALTSQQLHDAADKLASQEDIAAAHDVNSRGNAYIGAGIDPATGEPIPGGKADPKSKTKGKVSATGKPLLSTDKHSTSATSIGSGVESLKLLDPDRTDRAHTAPLLVAGHKSQPVYTTDSAGKQHAKLTKAGTPVTTPEIPKIGQLLATAAADMYYDGHISARTQRLLADQGYQISRLGVITRRQFKKSGARPPRRRSSLIDKVLHP